MLGIAYAFLLDAHPSNLSLQVGHAGTLDPMATGLLIVCVGKATKMVDRYDLQSILYNSMAYPSYFTFECIYHLEGRA